MPSARAYVPTGKRNVCYALGALSIGLYVLCFMAGHDAGGLASVRRLNSLLVRLAIPGGFRGHRQGNAVQDQVCQFPQLLLDDPSLRRYFKTHKPLKCASMKNWIYTKNGSVFLDSAATKAFGKVNCRIRDVFFKTDAKWDWSPYRNFTNGERLKQEAFIMNCTSSKGPKYKNLQIGVPRKPALLKTPPRKGTTGADGLNILVYLMDSMSRINTLRTLPRFYKVITKELGAVMMEGFNIVGDGTPWTMIPMLTGHFQTELYEGRKRFENSSTLDKWPLLFHDLKKENYVTSFAEEQPLFSFFSYKLRGFTSPPVDHYLRPFELAVKHVRKQHKSYCLGDTPRSVVLNHWWQDKQDVYRPRGIKTFSMLFSSETSHDDYNLVSVMDQHWEGVFRNQLKAGYFNDTFVIIMGDHGRRFGPVRKTQSGKIEEKLPFLAIRAPEKFRSNYSACWRNLQSNSKRLMTPFDLHETLKSIIHFDPEDCSGAADISKRGISLFQEIPPNRDCHHAAVKPHFCSCLKWEDIPVTSGEVKNTTDFIISKFNKALEETGDKCVPLELLRIDSAKKFHPGKDVLSYKQSADYDNIFPDLSADYKVHNAVYQIRLVTSPNGGEYEVSVSYFKDVDTYHMTFDDVSRLNSYSNQPHCILQSHPHLRPYCICEDMVGKEKKPLVDS